MTSSLADVNSGICSRALLKEHDPQLASVLFKTFGDRAWKYPQTAPKPWPAPLAPRERYDPINTEAWQGPLGLGCCHVAVALIVDRILQASGPHMEAKAADSRSCSEAAALLPLPAEQQRTQQNSIGPLHQLPVRRYVENERS